MATMFDPFQDRRMNTQEDFDEYRKWISDQKNPELDKLLEGYNRPLVDTSKPVKSDFQLMSEILDTNFSTRSTKHEELYRDLYVEDGTALRKAITKVIDPCAANGICRLPRTWLAELKQKFWKWYVKKFPKKVKYNRHVALVSNATKILRNMEPKNVKHKQD